MFAPPVAKSKSQGDVLRRSANTIVRAEPRQLQGLRQQTYDEKPGHGWDFANLPLVAPHAIESKPRFPVQAKLRVGAVDDPLEHEADRVACSVLDTPNAPAGPQCTNVRPSLGAGTSGIAPNHPSGLARLSEPDMQTGAARADKDIDTDLASMLKGNDLWLAQRVRQGKLGDTTGARSPAKKPQPVKVYFFQGSTDRRALVIAGVHGSGKQGIEVANRLLHDLQPPAPAPGLTTIVVPSLFPDNALLTGGAAREGATPTNRNFPAPSEDLAAATTRGGKSAVDATGRAILPENLMLIELIERFNPERIISIRGTQAPGQAGVFYDRRSPSEAEDRSARELAKGINGGQELPEAVQQRLYRARLAAISAGAEQTDRDLSLKAASQIDASTASLKGREARSMVRRKRNRGDEEGNP